VHKSARQKKRGQIKKPIRKSDEKRLKAYRIENGEMPAEKD
jgi:hypothetical protein